MADSMMLIDKLCVQVADDASIPHVLFPAKLYICQIAKQNFSFNYLVSKIVDKKHPPSKKVVLVYPLEGG